MAIVQTRFHPAVPAAAPVEAPISLRERLARREVTLRAADGQAYVVRPIRPTDAASLMRGYDALENMSKWFRMQHALPHLSPAMALDFCTPDPARDICLVVEGKGALAGEILGGARIAGQADSRTAEFSVSLRPEARHLDLARQALETVFAAGREMGYVRVYATIHVDNTPMKTLARRLKCRLRRDPEDGALMIAERNL
ncbi:GNAT family N-acetyltransferase [Methyloligella solikamskensis]|uniref:GNAT family N-acetyltransferase n=1 Tax=Methyloligella solikamskensis TaxID=1177756 RepID=A0ABW3J6L8_9HYPH